MASLAPRILLTPLSGSDVSLNCVIIGSGNGSSPVQRQAIAQTNDDLLSIEQKVIICFREFIL